MVSFTQDSSPSFMESIASGAKSGAEYTKSVEEARYAPQNALAELAINQGNARLAGQNAELNQYNVEAAGLIKQATTPIAAEQDYAAMYNSTTLAQQKLKLAKQKMAKAEQLKNATMASGKFSETTRQAYEDAQKEYKDLEIETKKETLATFQKMLAPVKIVKDQATYDYARPQLAKAARAIAEEEARKRGESEEFIKFLGPKVEQEELDRLPKNYGYSAKNMLNGRIAELDSIESSYKMEEQLRKEEEHKLNMKLKQAQIEKTRVEVDKLSREAKDGNSKATQDKIKELRQVVDTESRELNRMTDDKEQVIKQRLKDATDAVEGIWDSWNVPQEKLDEKKAAEDALKDLQARKALAQKTLEHSQQELALSLGIAKEKGIEPPPEEIDKNKKQEGFKKILAGYRTTSGAQGMSVEEVIADINKQKPEWTPEQVIQAAVKKGYIVSK